MTICSWRTQSPERASEIDHSAHLAAGVVILTMLFFV